MDPKRGKGRYVKSACLFSPREMKEIGMNQSRGKSLVIPILFWRQSSIRSSLVDGNTEIPH